MLDILSKDERTILRNIGAWEARSVGSVKGYPGGFAPRVVQQAIDVFCHLPFAENVATRGAFLDEIKTRFGTQNEMPISLILLGGSSVDFAARLVDCCLSIQLRSNKNGLSVLAWIVLEDDARRVKQERALVGSEKDLALSVQSWQGKYEQACQTLAAVVAATHGDNDCGSKCGIVADVESLRQERDQLSYELVRLRSLLEQHHDGLHG